MIHASLKWNLFPMNSRDTVKCQELVCRNFRRKCWKATLGYSGYNQFNYWMVSIAHMQYLQVVLQIFRICSHRCWQCFRFIPKYRRATGANKGFLSEIGPCYCAFIFQYSQKKLDYKSLQFFFWLHVQNSNSARMYETLCVSVSILRSKILIKTDFLRYKFGLTLTVSLVRSRGLRNQIELI